MHRSVKCLHKDKLLYVSFTKQHYSTVQPDTHKHKHSHTRKAPARHTHLSVTNWERYFSIFCPVIRFYVIMFYIQFTLCRLSRRHGLVVISGRKALPLGLAINQSCGSTVRTIEVTGLFDLNVGLYRCQCVCVCVCVTQPRELHVGLGVDMWTSVILFSSQAFFTLEFFPLLLFFSSSSRDLWYRA